MNKPAYESPIYGFYSEHTGWSTDDDDDTRYLDWSMIDDRTDEVRIEVGTEVEGPADADGNPTTRIESVAFDLAREELVEIHRRLTIFLAMTA